jgi:hypothetical protein
MLSVRQATNARARLQLQHFLYTKCGKVTPIKQNLKTLKIEFFLGSLISSLLLQLTLKYITTWRIVHNCWLQPDLLHLLSNALPHPIYRYYHAISSISLWLRLPACLSRKHISCLDGETGSVCGVPLWLPHTRCTPRARWHLASHYVWTGLHKLPDMNQQDQLISKHTLNSMASRWRRRGRIGSRLLNNVTLRCVFILGMLTFTAIKI